MSNVSRMTLADLLTSSYRPLNIAFDKRTEFHFCFVSHRSQDTARQMVLKEIDLKFTYFQLQMPQLSVLILMRQFMDQPLNQSLHFDLSFSQVSSRF